jgi:hypothetical protein
MPDAQPQGQPLPLLDQGDVERLKREAAPPSVPVARQEPPDREDATWFRLVTALSSCYVYVLIHTEPEPCRFEIDRGGRARCYVSDEVQWELPLPEAAHRQFGLVVRLWRDGGLSHCLQTRSMRLGEPRELPSGARSVDILPAVSPARRTRTLARK